MGHGTVPCPTKEPINEMSNMFFELYLTKISSLQELKTLFVKIMKEVSSVVETVDYPKKTNLPHHVNGLRFLLTQDHMISLLQVKTMLWS